MYLGHFPLFWPWSAYISIHPPHFCPPSPSSEKTAQKKLLLNPFRGLEELETEAVEIFI